MLLTGEGRPTNSNARLRGARFIAAGRSI